jgi:ubiquinol-cytochrome c reductase cytochrome b subunit
MDFLPFYAILRAIPSKIGGVIALFTALLILFNLSSITTLNIRTNRLRPTLNCLFWIFLFNFILLLWVGAQPIHSPFLLIGQGATALYFLYFLLLMLIG